MRVRKVDANNDMLFGHNQNDFWRDVPDGVAQVVQSRLMLYQKDWWLDRREGTPWKTQVLGKYTEATRDMVIRARILGTPGAARIDAYASQVDRDTREMTVQATVSTQYGATTVQVPL